MIQTYLNLVRGFLPVLKIISSLCLSLSLPLTALGTEPQDTPFLVNGFESVNQFYNDANVKTIKNLCESFYHKDIIFDDAVGHVEGREALIKYYLDLYSNLTAIKFEMHDEIQHKNKIFARWTMIYQHPSLNGEEPIDVQGVSYLEVKDGQVIYQRDYFDMGAMVYEKVPVIGTLVKWIKGRLESH
jgi:limonene-1,2-epoxide hydrolase